jgi:membrane protease YdiL (CAAX protease family)
MTIDPVWSQTGAAVLAGATAWAFDRATVRRGLAPPGFGLDVRGAIDPAAGPSASVRWILALALVAGMVYLAGYSSLAAMFGPPPPPRDFASMARLELFTLQGLLLAVVLAWHALGFRGVDWPGRGEGAPRPESYSFARQFGLATPRPWSEIGLGVLLGLATWAMVLVGVLVVYLGIAAVFGDDAIPQKPPDAIPFLVGLPFAWRVALALSAGFFEELFFRGFLQPRVGILASTALFAAAHLGYGQPFMLVGITILSLLYAGIVRWRQSLWAAVAAHATFDAVQILIVIPSLLKFMPES